MPSGRLYAQETQTGKGGMDGWPGHELEVALCVASRPLARRISSEPRE